MNFLQTSKTGFIQITILLLLLTGVVSCQKNKPNKKNAATELLPAPQEITFKGGISINPEKFKTVYLYSATNEDARFAADLLKTETKRLFDYEIKVKVVQSYADLSLPAIVLGISSEDAKFADFSSNLPSPQKDNSEAYVLDIKKI